MVKESKKSVIARDIDATCEAERKDLIVKNIHDFVLKNTDKDIQSVDVRINFKGDSDDD